MSEFTEAYYLRTKNRDDVIELIKQANMKGYVFPEKNGWVTFVVNGEFSSAPEQLIKSNQGILVHFENAEDHGWKFEIYKKDKLSVYYECSIEHCSMEDFDMNDLEMYTPSLAYNVKLDSPVLAEVLREIDEDNRIRAVIYLCLEDAKNKSNEPIVTSYHYAEKMGFFFFDWISYHYIELDHERTGKILYGDVPLLLVK